MDEIDGIKLIATNDMLDELACRFEGMIFYGMRSDGFIRHLKGSPGSILGVMESQVFSMKADMDKEYRRAQDSE